METKSRPKNPDAAPNGVQVMHALHTHSRRVSPSVAKSAVGLWGTKMCGGTETLTVLTRRIYYSIGNANMTQSRDHL